MKPIVRLLLVFALMMTHGFGQEAGELRTAREAMESRGLWRDIISQYEEKYGEISDEQSGRDLQVAVNALNRLNAWEEFDGLVERAVEARPANAQLLEVAAIAYRDVPHRGKVIGGEFRRDPRGGYVQRGEPGAAAGVMINTGYRDRIRAMQLFRKALENAADDTYRGWIWKNFALLLKDRQDWELQTLTPLAELPAWDESGPEGGTEGAPWAGDRPVIYEVPASWEVAKNDGERWRFALAEHARLVPQGAPDVIMELARFSQMQFGVQTLAYYGWWQSRDTEDRKGILEVDTLADDECLARTSDGVRRFKLGPAHHFIALYRSILADPSYGGTAGDVLTQVYLNRRQYDKARLVLEETIAKHGPGPEDSRKALLRQITGNWGRFEAAATVPGGVKPRLPLVFRNASGIRLTAAPVDMDQVLKDTIDYLKSNPENLAWERLNPSNVASRLIRERSSKFVGPVENTWDVALQPREKHLDTRTDLELPMDRPGAWWITGECEGGATFHTLVWIIDQVLVNRDVAGNKQWWVAEAGDGAPVAGAKIEFFGYRTVDRERKIPLGRRMDVRVTGFERETDADGKILLKPGDCDPEYQWLAIARKPGKSPAFEGFTYIGITGQDLENGNRDLTYGITDRPLYKPGDPIHVKFYLRNVGYAEPDEKRFAGKTGKFTLLNGRGEEALKIDGIVTDAEGAVTVDAILPKDAPLGQWRAQFEITDIISTGIEFQVEEFRKPEYEVTVEAPAEPVKLGDTFTAKVKAAYFHGAPVRNAEVEIIVKRASLGERWFPAGRWDWLYGRGAWWGAPVAEWHPTWSSWGCIAPTPSWWNGGRWTPEELVLKRNVSIGEDGTATVEVDTAPAKEIHGDLDARYTIEARVVDASRREERGTGEVIAARKSLEVVVWLDRGFARAGEPLQAKIAASTLAGKPVAGAKGTLKLFKLVTGEGGRIEETEAASWPIATDAEGSAAHKFAAPATGQYRLAATLALEGGTSSEGGTIVNIQGPGRADPADWRFGPLELVADKESYTPGETLRLRINSDQPDANVWLFLHVAGAAGRESKRIRLDGKSQEIEVALDRRDMPNIFIEGVTVYGAGIHSAVRQILLPPEKQLLEVTLEPAKSRVKPGEKSSLQLVLKDAQGKPVAAEAVLAVYDKALEAITGGSNVPPISEAFWGWKNNYYPGYLRGAVPQSPGNLLREKTIGMSSLGVLGDLDGRMGGRGGALRTARQDVESSFLDAIPASAAAPLAKEMAAAPAQGGQGGGGAQPARVRKDFADLLKWSGTIRTDREGKAVIPLEFPDNLTTWKARVWTLASGTRVGEGGTEVIASKELLVRLQAPRFLVERDESVFSGVVHNDHEAAKTVSVSLELDGGAIEVIDGGTRTIEIPPHGEARVDWRVKAVKEGEAIVRMRAEAGDDGDAVERKLPVHVHGMLRQDAWSRVIEPGADSTTIGIEVPEQRRADQTHLTIRYSPTIAGAVVDAIPYLASYPHGCTEQTLNRFVPAVIAAGMLKDLKINLAEVKAKRVNLNPQELGSAPERAARWKQWQDNPVFDEVELGKMVSAGIERLEAMQNSDGGWGWFSGYSERSYPHTTAVVVHGLLVARESGAEIPARMLDAGIAWLVASERREAAALQLHVERQALRDAGKKVKPTNQREKSGTDSMDAFIRLVLGEAKRDSEPMLAFLHRDRLGLPVYAQCLLGLEHHRKNDTGRRDEVMATISQFLKRDAENQTVYLDLKNGDYWWYWYGSDVEAHAWYLKLLSAVKPNDPDTRGLVKYLVNNRGHSTYWKSTRDTSFAVEAIAGYFKASGEDAPDSEVEVLMDGKSIRKIFINRENLFSFDGTITLSGDAVSAGKHAIEIRRAGKGALYANAYLEVFTLEDRLRAAGLEVKVDRKVSKLVALTKENEVPDAKGLIAVQTEERFRREPLADGATLKSGDRIEVELILESKNDYEYLIFSDAKAAGFEALDALSGYIHGSSLSAYMEPRDRTVDFYLRSLPRGTHSLRYQLRAEAPGIYKALPAVAEAMYAPELRANSEDFKIGVEDK